MGKENVAHFYNGICTQQGHYEFWRHMDRTREYHPKCRIQDPKDMHVIYSLISEY